MLDYAWIIPAIPALSFVLILFFGKKLPKHGSEIGITALAVSFVLACVTAVQWIQHVNDAEGKSAGGVLQAFGKGFLAHSGDHETVVKPVINTVTWWQNGGVKFTDRHPDRRPRGDDALRRHADLAAGAHLLHELHARRHALHLLLRRAEPLHCVDAHCSSSPRTRSSC